MTGISANDVPGLFHVDGSWRDIYVLDTTEANWDRFLMWVRQSYADAMTYYIDGEPSEMPSTVAAIFALREVASPQLEISLNGLVLKCHFLVTRKLNWTSIHGN